MELGETASGSYAPVAPYAISPATGPCRSVSELLSRQPVESRGDCEAWLERLAAFPRALDAATEAFRIDLGAGVAPPAFAMAASLAHLRTATDLPRLLGDKAAAAGIAGNWQEKADALVRQALHPALDRQAAAIEQGRAGGADGGVLSLPNGRDFYADALAFHSGAAFSAEELHRRAMAELAGTAATAARSPGALTNEVGALASGSDVPAIRRLGTRYPAWSAGWSAYIGDGADGPAGVAARRHQAALMVADTGLHDRGWSRERAAAFLVETTGQSGSTALSAVNRCCFVPGEAASPFAGRLGWQRLRTLAERVAGAPVADDPFASLASRGPAPFGLLEDEAVRRFSPRRSVLQARTSDDGGTPGSPAASQRLSDIRTTAHRLRPGNADE